MFCKKCGAYNEDNATFCSGCGENLTKEDNLYTPEIIPETENSAPSSADDPGNTFGLISMIIGIAGTVIELGCCCCGTYGLIGQGFCFLAGIAGFVLGFLGNKKSKEAGFKNSKALVGIILSIITVLLFIVNIILTVAGLALGAGLGFMSSFMSY
ncbi:MAG: zinc-ribbon domain-containing protein [Ruminococcaceae bacterium]|nr:zinc-ribbon domain-containing protein [Oscillospiraceae bacterium]